MSSVLNDLGQLHIGTYLVAANGESMTTNDGSATIATNGTGDFTITFGQAFTSAPMVVATPVVATVAATDINEVTIAAVATNSAQIVTRTYTQNATVAAAADMIVNVLVAGTRNI